VRLPIVHSATRVQRGTNATSDRIGALSELSRRTVLAGVSAFALSACGGGGSSASTAPIAGPTPGPTPTPTPAPTPAPTPTPTPNASGPFRAGVSDQYLRELVTDFWVEGGDPEIDYILNYETAFFAGSNLYRIRLILRDAQTGTDVAMWARQGNTDFRSDLPNTVFFTQRILPQYTGITAIAHLDRTKIDWSKTALTTYTQPDEAGLVADRILSRSEIETRFAAASEPAITLTVGAGMATGTHFNSFKAAIESLYSDNTTITRSTFPCSDIASFTNQVCIECVDSNYSEEMIARRIGNIDQGILVPPFVTLKGRGDTLLFLPDTGGTAPVLEAPFSFRIEGLNLENRGQGYAIHIDNANGLSRRDERNRSSLHFPLISVMKDTRFIGSSNQLTWLQGCGISNGHLMVMDNCDNEAAIATNMFGIHNSPGTTDAGRVEIRNSRFNDAQFSAAAAVQLVTSSQQPVVHEVVATNSTLGRITNGATVQAPLAFIVR